MVLERFFLDTCSAFEATMSMYDKNNNLLAGVQFNLSTSFDFYGNDIDYRNLVVESSQIFGDTSAANLDINLVDECSL